MSGWVVVGQVLTTAVACLWANRKFAQTNELVEKMGFAIMAQVSIEQESLDDVATALDGLTAAVSEIDTTKLEPADQSKLQSALSGLTSAVNAKLPIDVEPGDEAV